MLKILECLSDCVIKFCMQEKIVTVFLPQQGTASEKGTPFLGVKRSG